MGDGEDLAREPAEGAEVPTSLRAYELVGSTTVVSILELSYCLSLIILFTHFSFLSVHTAQEEVLGATTKVSELPKEHALRQNAM
jgi:hypothetical protein